MNHPTRLLYLFRDENPDARPAFAPILEARGWQVDARPISEFAKAKGILDVFRIRLKFRSYDVIAVSEYFLTWAVCARLLFHPAKPKIVAIGFNQSSRIFHTRWRFVDRLINRIWRRTSTFVVHSRAEGEMFAKIHDIPADRFVFSYWGYDLPAHDRRKTKIPVQPYVTMIGRNNRDLATFCAAVEQAGVHGVLITAQYMVDRYPVRCPPNVQLLTDRPMDECLNYVAGSFAHLVLVVDGERGAGHISAVSAMLLGKPQIFSDVATLADYLKDDFDAIAVPVGDAAAVAAAIRRLKDNPKLADRLGNGGRAFALKYMANDAATRSIAETLIAAAEG